ncbi:Lipid A core - O-antigen ligase and related enzymes [Dermatophilus congolensis]|uniref:Lipid A core - O-antigen ligase and related enzymes n=1 Tax=Dermatophilus congolensis TaxID=1863 RepID=A0A239VTF2_9MICO|nr:O-antigen ligase family protein [Dermatophilus congolensis]SNV25545.1 Lipid A core - O-antigen ligase and related enzymes [Dermatophilus congolensis]
MRGEDIAEESGLLASGELNTSRPLLVTWFSYLVAAGGACAVVFTVAGGLLSLPLHEMGLENTFLCVVASVSFVAFISSGPHIFRPIAWALPFFVAAFVFWSPYALARTPDVRAGELELTRLFTAFVMALAVYACTQATSVGMTGMRLGWFFGLVLSVGVAGWEIFTRQHLWISARNPFIFPEPVVVGTYINPNNFATALVAMIVGAIALAAQSRSRLFSVVVLGVVAAGCVAVVVTQSRSGVLALVVVLALEVRRRMLTRRGDRSLAWRQRCAGVSGRARVLVGVVCGVICCGVVAAFTVPALVARNPVMQMLVAQGGSETRRSDTLRLQLLKAAWRYLRDSGWLGSGAGSFEYLLWHDPAPATLKLTNLHNAFMELLTQYGVPIAVCYGVFVIGVLVTLAGSVRVPDTRVARYEAVGYLIALIALGIAASSALHVGTWWVMHAAAGACAWRVATHTHRLPLRGQEAARSVDPGGKDVC